MTIEEVKKTIFKEFKYVCEVGSEYSEGQAFAYDRVLNLLAYVEEPTPITDDEVKNHVIGLHNYCLSKTDCKGCIFKDAEGCNYYMPPSQWHIPQQWMDES